MIMVEQITKGIRVSVNTYFEGSFTKNEEIFYAFGYRVTITNTSNDTVQLLSRSWSIFDALNHPERVVGEGVIGKKPVLKSRETHTYSSGCLLKSPFGSMKGYYIMINFTTSEQFKVEIPSFNLNAIHILN